MNHLYVIYKFMIKFSDCPKFSINNSTTSDFRESSITIVSNWCIRLKYKDFASIQNDKSA